MSTSAVFAVFLSMGQGCQELVPWSEGANAFLLPKHHQIVGAWCYVGSNGIPSEFGFELKEDGTASSVNVQLPDVGRWQLEGDMLILSAVDSEQSGSRLRADTFDVDVVSQHRIRLSKGGLSFDFVRK